MSSTARNDPFRGGWHGPASLGWTSRMAWTNYALKVWHEARSLDGPLSLGSISLSWACKPRDEYIQFSDFGKPNSVPIYYQAEFEGWLNENYNIDLSLLTHKSTFLIVIDPWEKGDIESWFSSEGENRHVIMFDEFEPGKAVRDYVGIVRPNEIRKGFPWKAIHYMLRQKGHKPSDVQRWLNQHSPQAHYFIRTKAPDRRTESRVLLAVIFPNATEATGFKLSFG